MQLSMSCAHPRLPQPCMHELTGALSKCIDGFATGQDQLCTRRWRSHASAEKWLCPFRGPQASCAKKKRAACCGAWRRHQIPEDATHVPASGKRDYPKCSSTNSSTPSHCCKASLARICATPRFFCHPPALLPVCEARVAVVRRGGRSNWSATTTRIGASFAMHTTTPFLLSDRPPGLPVGEAICAVVWVCWASGLRQHWHGNRHRKRRGWRNGLWAPTVVDPATPILLVRLPRVLGIDSAIEGVNWPRRCRRCNRARCRRWRCGRWGRWQSGRWCGWLRGRWLKCGWLRSGASPAHGRAAVLLLRRGPIRLPVHEARLAIVQPCGDGARQQPKQEGNQQQETQKAACRDQACEISPH